MSVSSLKPPASSPAAPAAPERTVASVWPSIAASGWGQWLGRLYENRTGVRIAGVPLTLGWLTVVLSAPFAALLYVGRKAPRKPFIVFGPINADCVRYRVTDQRVVIEHPLELDKRVVAELPLGGFDEVVLDEHPGQAWFHASDIVFRQAGEERFRLAGVARPEPFVQTVLKTQRAFAG